jgi:hypothetical protein
LVDVLLPAWTVPERFFLSPRAAAGILRRAERRRRELPRALREALVALASDLPMMERVQAASEHFSGEERIYVQIALELP